MSNPFSYGTSTAYMSSSNLQSFVKKNVNSPVNTPSKLGTSNPNTPSKLSTPTHSSSKSLLSPRGNSNTNNNISNSNYNTGKILKRDKEGRVIPSFDDWIEFIDAWNWSAKTRAQFLETFALETETQILTLIHHHFETTMALTKNGTIEKMEYEGMVLKIRILNFLQENATFLYLDTKIDSTVQVLNKVLSGEPSDLSSPSANLIFQIQAQILITLTHILINLNIYSKQPHLIEFFIPFLFEILLKKSNNGFAKNRTLREAASQSLCEFELEFPGIFKKHCSIILYLCQNEKTHIVQSNMVLLSTILEHFALDILKNEDEQSSPTIISNIENESFSFSFPESFFTKLIPVSLNSKRHLDFFENNFKKNLKKKKLNSLQNQNFKKIISVLLDSSSSLLTPWGIYSVLVRILTFVEFSDLDPKIFRHYCSKYRFTQKTILFQLILILKKNFPKIFLKDEELFIFKQIISYINDQSLMLEKRILFIKILTDFENFEKSQFFENMSQNFNELKPKIFDPLSLKHPRFHALIHCFQQKEPPKNFLEIFNSVQEFKYYEPPNIYSAIVFSSLSLYLDKFPSLLNQIYNFIVEPLKKDHKFCLPVINFLFGLKNLDLKTKILRKFLNFVIDLENEVLGYYLTLISEIVSDKDIKGREIIPILEKLIKTIRSTTFINSGWASGNLLLEICSFILRNSNTLILFKPLVEILQLLSDFHNDIEIRDRSRIYYLLLTHIPSEKIRKIISTPEQILEDEQTAKMISSSYNKNTNYKTSDPLISSFLKFESNFPNSFSENITKFILEKNENQNEEEFFGFDSEGNPITQSTEHFFEQYKSFICDESIIPEIQKEYLISFKNQISFPPKVFSLILKFQILVSSYQQEIPGYHIPLLSALPKNEKIENFEKRFPFFYFLKIKISPNLPIPTMIKIKAKFNDHEGKIKEKEMDPISIYLEDLFLPILLPSHLPRHKTIPIIFDTLWKSEDLQVSIKLISLEFQIVLKKLKKDFSSWIINNNQNENQDNCQLLILLPKKYDLLFIFEKKEDEEDKTLCHIKSDFPSCFLFLDDFFAKFFSK